MQFEEPASKSESGASMRCDQPGAGWQAIVSVCSGETEDMSVNHLVTGLGAGQLKEGSVTRPECMAKWNECLRIQDDLGAGPFVSGEPLSATL